MRAHGTPGRYRHGPDENDQPGRGCRCRLCSNAACKTAKRYRLSVQSGRHRPMVDAQPVREHVAKLYAAGLPYNSIATLAGVPIGLLQRLMYGRPASGELPSKVMRPENADALLAVRADLVASDGHALAVGSQRRLRALAWAGWPCPYLAPKVQLHPDHMGRIMRGIGGGRVTVEVARRIQDVFAQLWLLDPVVAGVPAANVSQVRTVSARKGWVSALAWDDIDDPNAVPDLGQRTNRDIALFEDSEELVAQGYTPEQVAGRLGVKPGYLRRIRSECRRLAEAVAS